MPFKQFLMAIKQNLPLLYNGPFVTKWFGLTLVISLGTCCFLATEVVHHRSFKQQLLGKTVSQAIFDVTDDSVQ